MLEVLKTFAVLYVGLFAITNPIGAVPVFMGVVSHLAPEKRHEVAEKVSITVLVTLLTFALIGKWIFKFFGSSVDAFAIAGGILLFRMGMEMLSGKLSSVKIDEEEVTLEEVAVIPLAIPLISGPGAITTVMLYMTRESPPIVIATIIAIGISVYVILISGNKITEKLGRVGIKVTTRMMGLILTSMAIQMIINGIKGAFGI
ncbi:multiple antibiotic resistance protein related protein [Pyrococcus sp. NA2]|uniref:neutral amino acid NAAT transporter SnatA n=1 Tax=Pyrococcus sp. (strain NA2) TaxID=342949 RepID=UPI000209AEA1|nr:neutral amino acid NAAT transporter SnatA [Pyrococcus sp. NA2]AEC52303.1 multiple antibiotic resistance protein related protein [Pyrococcus sp. NA2]